MLRKGKHQFVARTSCPICGSTSYQLHLVLDQIRTVKCSRCNFLFTYDILSADVLLDAYRSGYEGERQKCGQQVNADVNLRVVERLISKFEGLRFLDVGSGYGFFLQQLRKAHRVQVTGLDLSDHEREFSRTILGIETLCSVEEIESGRRFDVITLFEVVEHLPNPPDFLERLTACLETGGYMVVGTDNFESAVVRTMGAEFPKWIPHEHISLFSDATLPKLIKGAPGLELVGVASFTPWELRARQLMFALSGGRGGKTYNMEEELRTENTRNFKVFGLRKFLNSIWVSATLRRDLAGEMMYVVARKL